MRETKRVALDGSMFSVSDPGARGPLPRRSGSSRIASDSNYLVVGTLMSQDGDTEVTLSDSVDEVAAQGAPAFDGTLETPSRRLVLQSADLEVFLEMKTEGPRSRVRVWSNDPREPDQIAIVVGNDE